MRVLQEVLNSYMGRNPLRDEAIEAAAGVGY